LSITSRIRDINTTLRKNIHIKKANVKKPISSIISLVFLLIISIIDYFRHDVKRYFTVTYIVFLLSDSQQGRMDCIDHSNR